MPALPEQTGVEVYKKPSAGIGLLYLAIATTCLFVAIFLYLVGDRSAATAGWAGSLVILGFAFLVLAYSGKRMGNLAKFEIDRDGITEFDKWGNRGDTLAWPHVVSFSPLEPRLGGAPTWMILAGSTVQMKTPMQSSGAPLLTQSILDHLPDGVTPSGIMRARDLLDRRGPSSGRRVFGRLGLLGWALLILVFGILSLYAYVADPQVQQHPLGFAWIPLLFLSLGIPGMIAALNEKYIVSDEGIRHVDWLGRTKEDIAWSDVKSFLYQRMQSGKGGTTYYYSLIGSREYLPLDSLITKWKDLRVEILARIPEEAWVYVRP